MIKATGIHKIIFLTLILSSTFVFLSSAEEQNSNSSYSASYDEGIRKVLKRGNLEKQARLLEKQGLYKEAILKYKESIQDSLLNHEYEASTGHGGIMNIYVKQGKFEDALKELQWFITTNYNPAAKPWLDQQLELESLIKSRDTKSAKPIYDHIQYLREKHKKYLPPKGADVIMATPIIRLYDYIGDYDGGIAFVEGFIEFYAKRWRVKPENIGSKNPYFQVKQAFEADKKEDRKSCFGKTGVCMGRATKAPIQSDYFPW